MSDLPGRESSWPEPGLLGMRGLVDVAQKGQVERHEDFHFWEQVAERAVVLRDVMDVGRLGYLDGPLKCLEDMPRRVRRA